MWSDELTLKALEQAPDVIIATDRAGHIRVWNSRAVEVFGFSAAEAADVGLDAIIPVNLRPAHWKAFHAAIESGTAKSKGRPTRTRAVHKDGSRLYLEISFGLLKDESGQTIGAVA